jgi:hypothetical protein
MKCRENGNILDEYRSLFKATAIMVESIPKHASYRKEERWKKLYAELKTTLRDDVVRLEKLKEMIKSGQVTAFRTVKPGCVRVEASRMPTVDWTLHTPTVAGSAHVPQNYFVSNPTVERMASQPDGPVAAVASADPNDPFAASAAFSSLSLAPTHPPPPVPASSYTGMTSHPRANVELTCGYCYSVCYKQV